jgi:Spy/CpxP family protein refolding chaperone
MFLLGAFLVGGTLGFTVDRTWGDRWLGRASDARTMVDVFAEQLDLTPTQRAAVDSILDERNRIMDSITAPVRPRLQAAREEARRKIATRLNPEQRRKFEEYKARTDKKESTKQQ